MLDPTSWGGMFAQYGRSLLWAITAAIGFGLGVGIALKVFDWLSTDIDEWEEIKKRKHGCFHDFYRTNRHGWFNRL